MTSTRKNKLCDRIIGAALVMSIMGGIISEAATLTIWRKPPLQYRNNVPGTLGYALTTNLETRLAGVSTNDLCPVADVASDPTNWTWNASSPWHGMTGKSGLIYRRFCPACAPGGAISSAGGLLVSPRIILTAKHATHGSGDTVWGLGTNGTPASATVIASADLADSYNVNDGRLQLLSNALTNCEPLRVLPANATSYLVYGFPILGQSVYTGTEKRLYPFNCAYFSSGVSFSVTTNFPAQTLTLPLTAGSGNAHLVCLDNELIGLSTWYTGYGANWSSSYNFDAINEAMSNLCVAAGISVEQLTPVDLSGYTQL